METPPSGPATTWWPLFDILLVTPRLTLRAARDDDIPGLVEAIDAGVHPPDIMPFSVPWTDAPPKERARGTAQHFWHHRASWSANSWHLNLAVLRGGRPVGIQSLYADEFPVLQEVETGSWLTMAAQGHGLGKEMRAAVLQFAFEGLGAVLARSGAFIDNGRSLAVSRALGYRENGTYRIASRGSPRTGVRLELSRQDWQARRAQLPRAQIMGLEGCIDMFGAKAGPVT